MKKKSVAVVIITNGPGELSTWVKPIIDQLYKIHNSSDESNKVTFSLRLILVPCPHATGKEYEVAKSWGKFELITKPIIFWKFLINPYSYSKWPEKGIVVFLGGDQFWSILLSKRLGYLNIIYAECVARWPQWANIITAMNFEVKKRLPQKYKSKCEVIGDLMADIPNKKVSKNLKDKNWIALLPGSKKTKLSIGIPFFLEMADHISKINKNINLMIPIAPTTNLEEFHFFQSNKNPISVHYKSKIKIIKPIQNSLFNYVLVTSNNTKIYLTKEHPSYGTLKECELAITTVGANTAELAALTLPMIVVLPTQHLEIMNAWEGIYGLIGKISFINKFLAFIIKNWYLKKKKFLAWPNIKAKKLIVPERIGKITPKEIAEEAQFLITNKKYLKKQKEKLSKQRGKKGAVQKLSSLIYDSIKRLS